MKAKEALVCRSAFLKPPIGLEPESSVLPGVAHRGVTEEKIFQALMSQSATKAPGTDKINFRILRMIWEWDKVQMTSMVHQAVNLGYHPKE